MPVVCLSLARLSGQAVTVITVTVITVITTVAYSLLLRCVRGQVIKHCDYCLWSVLK